MAPVLKLKLSCILWKTLEWSKFLSDNH